VKKVKEEVKEYAFIIFQVHDNYGTRKVLSVVMNPWISE
jgi:hypothetical protein